MPPITVVAGEVAGAPKPVLCLDTCDILEVVQCLAYERFGVPRDAGCIESARRLLDAFVLNPDRVRLVITELVVTEWNQNIGPIRAAAERHLTHVDETVERLYRAAQPLDTAILAWYAGGAPHKETLP